MTDTLNEKHERAFSLIIILVLLAYFAVFAIVNFAGFAYFCNADMYEDTLVARLMWEQKTLFPENYIFGNQYYVIATPVFAHTVDFLYGDYMAQEHTEGRTGELIRGSEGITRLLDKYNIAPDAVTDYHIYPVADNDSPRLSADRLEYTLGNLAAYTGRTSPELQAYYDDLCVAVNEHGETELSFTGADMAYRFAHDALEMSRIYVSDEDRYAMQMLSELLGQAIKKGVLSAEELYLTEETVIENLMSDAETAKLWRGYCALHEIVTDREAFPDGAWRVIGAKKRRIDPFVRGAAV